MRIDIFPMTLLSHQAGGRSHALDAEFRPCIPLFLEPVERVLLATRDTDAPARHICHLPKASLLGA